MTLLPRFGLTLAAVFALAACGADAPTPASPDTSAASETAVPASANAEHAAAPASSNAGGSETLIRTPGPILPPTGPIPVAGVDYVEIPGGQPFQPATGKIEVVEVFGYTCPACASFEPVVTAWATKLPEDVQFVPLAAPFGGYWMPFAKAYYAAQSMGLLTQSHDAVFSAIHLERILSPDASDAKVAQYFSRFGADPKQFASTMASFGVKAKMGRVVQFLQRSGVDSTPSLIVDGKYRIIGGDSWEAKLGIAEHLIASERAAMEAAPAPPSGEG